MLFILRHAALVIGALYAVAYTPYAALLFAAGGVAWAILAPVTKTSEPASTPFDAGVFLFIGATLVLSLVLLSTLGLYVLLGQAQAAVAAAITVTAFYVALFAVNKFLDRVRPENTS